MQDTKRRIRLVLAKAHTSRELGRLLRLELGRDLDRIEEAYLGEGTRFVTVRLKPDIGPIMVEGVGWSEPFE